MELPSDQRQLYHALTAKLESLESAQQLISFVGEVLYSLLRRKGDAEFRRAVQDSFTTGMAGRPWEQQVTLAREVIGLVITKRPEVALAWQTLHHEEQRPYQRRTTDQDSLPPGPELDDLPDFSLSPEEDEDPPPAIPFSHAEQLVAEEAGVLMDQVLAPFAIAAPGVPSSTYTHEQPFFLISPVFAAVARRFVARGLLDLVRDGVQRRILEPCGAGVLADDDRLRSVLIEKRPQLQALLAERLGKLAIHQRAAEAKLASGASATDGPEFQVVEVPVTRPRVMRVLGVAFTLGSRTDMKRMKFRVRESDEPTADEMTALEILTRWRDMAARAGLDLPPACDFAFLRDLLQTDSDKISRDLSALRVLGGAKETPRDAVLQRLQALDLDYPAGLSDGMAVTAFHLCADGAFNFSVFHELNARQGRNSPRPFLAAEIGRRPRDLAFQIRDSLRKHNEGSRLGLAVVMLLEVWTVMDKAAFRSELDAALTVFSAFPVAFAGDPDEKPFTQIGSVLFRGLSADSVDAAAMVESVLKIHAATTRA